MADPVQTSATIDATLTAMKGVGQPYAAATMILIVQPFTPSEGLVIGDVVEATFDGYARVAGLVFGSPFIRPDGKWAMAAPSETFELTGLTVLETVYGVGYTNVGVTALHSAQLLDVPIPLTIVGQGGIIQPEVVWPG